MCVGGLRAYSWIYIQTSLLVVFRGPYWSTVFVLGLHLAMPDQTLLLAQYSALNIPDGTQGTSWSARVSWVQDKHQIHSSLYISSILGYWRSNSNYVQGKHPTSNYLSKAPLSSFWCCKRVHVWAKSEVCLVNYILMCSMYFITAILQFRVQHSLELELVVKEVIAQLGSLHPILFIETPS